MKVSANIWRRDKRKEFNERSEALFVDISKHTEGIGSGVHVEAKTRLIIEPYIFPCKRSGFRKAVENYNAAQNCMSGVFDPVTGSGGALDEEKVRRYQSCASKLLCYLNRK